MSRHGRPSDLLSAYRTYLLSLASPPTSSHLPMCICTSCRSGYHSSRRRKYNGFRKGMNQLPPAMSNKAVISKLDASGAAFWLDNAHGSPPGHTAAWPHALNPEVHFCSDCDERLQNFFSPFPSLLFSRPTFSTCSPLLAFVYLSIASTNRCSVSITRPLPNDGTRRKNGG